MYKKIRIVEIMLKNKKAYYNYFIIEKEVAGIMLRGSELKPLRENRASIVESFIFIKKDSNEVWIKNMYIKNCNNNAYSHEEYRDRKLLMTKKQIKKWRKIMETQKLTIVPLSLYFDKNNRVKMEISLAKGKKLHDKRKANNDKEHRKHMKNNI